jgi:hypothetical protein
MSYEKIKTFEDACTKLGLNPESLPDVSMIPEKHRTHTIANYKLITIAEALNDGWEPNWDSSNEWKYAPYFRMSSSGFSSVDCGYGDSISALGSRLCFKSREIAIYAGTQFTEIYKDQMLILK